MRYYLVTVIFYKTTLQDSLKPIYFFTASFIQSNSAWPGLTPPWCMGEQGEGIFDTHSPTHRYVSKKEALTDQMPDWRYLQRWRNLSASVFD